MPGSSREHLAPSAGIPLSGRWRYLLAFALALLGGAWVVQPPHVAPFAVIGVGALVVGVFASPVVTLLLYLLFAVGFVQEWVPFFFELPHVAERAAGLAVIGSVLVGQARQRTLSLRLTSVGRALLLLCAAFATTVVTAYWVTAWKDAMYEFLRQMVLFLAIVNVATTQRRIKTIVAAYVLIVCVLSLMSVKYYYEGHRVYRMGIWRAVGPGWSLSDPNAHAMTLVYLLPFLLALRAWWRRVVVRAGLACLALIVLWNVVITGSRSGALGVVTLLAYYGLRSRRRALSLSGGAAIVLLAVTVMPPQYLERFRTATDFSGETSASQSAVGRWQGFVAGLGMFSGSPLTGVGYGCYTVVHGTQTGSWTASHNLAGQLLGETGLVGSVAFFVFLGTIAGQIRSVRRAARVLPSDAAAKQLDSLAEAIAVGFGLLLLMGLGAHNLNRYNWFLYAGLIASIGALDLQPAGVREHVVVATTDDRRRTHGRRSERR